MEIIQAVILAIVQGLTEFLPVSSSGHLVIARQLFRIPDEQGVAFDAFLHLGTLCAVLLFYWKVWWGISRSLFVNAPEEKDKRELVAKLAVATVPGAVAGYFFQSVVGEFFRSSTSVAVGLFITAGILFIGEYLAKEKEGKKRASFTDAAYIGIAQMFALLPGISRSGSTIAAARARGLSRIQATHFSFLLSAPIIAGAGLASLGQLLEADSTPIVILLIGFLVSFVSGIAGITLLLRLIQKVSFIPFTLYLLIVGCALLFFT